MKIRRLLSYAMENDYIDMLKPDLMKRYIVKSHHTAEDCRQAVKHFIEYHANYLTHFEWGCYDDDHTAYAIIEAEDHEQAKLSVPSLFRDKAEVIELTRFTGKKAKDKVHY